MTKCFIHFAGGLYTADELAPRGSRLCTLYA